MYKNHKILALIPARGGSKSIPRKNIKLLGGKPLIAHSIEQGLAAKHVDRVILSTDDQEIADIARKWGAEVPFMRPAEFAGDHVQDWPVFNHALGWLKENENWIPDIVVTLRPTHPFRQVSDIDKGIEMLVDHKDADAVWTVGEPPVTPYKMFSVGGDKYIHPALTISGEKETFNWPRQKLPKVYNHYGQVDVTRYDVVVNRKSMNGEKILPIFLEKENLVDLDTPMDWEFADFLMNKKHNPNINS